MNGQLTKIEDIAPIVMFLATSGWWITGQVCVSSLHHFLTFRLSLPMADTPLARERKTLKWRWKCIYSAPAYKCDDFIGIFIFTVV